MKYQNVNSGEVVEYVDLATNIYKEQSIPKEGTVEIGDYHVITATLPQEFDSTTHKAVELHPVDYVTTWTIEPLTQAELDTNYQASVPPVLTMRQARLALLANNLLATVTTAIEGSTDEEMKIEWEYATEVRRDWPSLIAMSTSLGLTGLDLDNLFILGATL